MTTTVLTEAVPRLRVMIAYYRQLLRLLVPDTTLRVLGRRVAHEVRRLRIGLLIRIERRRIGITVLHRKGNMSICHVSIINNTDNGHHPEQRITGIIVNSHLVSHIIILLLNGNG